MFGTFHCDKLLWVVLRQLHLRLVFLLSITNSFTEKFDKFVVLLTPALFLSGNEARLLYTTLHYIHCTLHFTFNFIINTIIIIVNSGGAVIITTIISSRRGY